MHLVRADPGDEQLEAALVEREHPVAFRLLPPEVDQHGQALGLDLRRGVDAAPLGDEEHLGRRLEDAVLEGKGSHLGR